MVMNFKQSVGIRLISLGSKMQESDIAPLSVRIASFLTKYVNQLLCVF